jgi:hypothetical protein
MDKRAPAKKIAVLRQVKIWLEPFGIYRPVDKGPSHADGCVVVLTLGHPPQQVNRFVPGRHAVM